MATAPVYASRYVNDLLGGGGGGVCMQVSQIAPVTVACYSNQSDP